MRATACTARSLRRHAFQSRLFSSAVLSARPEHNQMFTCNASSQLQVNYGPRYRPSRTCIRLNSSQAATSSDQRQLTKDDIAQIEAGTHAEIASVSSPHRTVKREKIRTTELQAPHIGVIKILTLDDAPSMNALGHVLVDELSDAIEAIHAEAGSASSEDSTRVLILASALDKAYCAGANLKERATMTADETRAFLSKMRNTFARLQALPIPCIAAVNGLALGGGLELALRAHARIFASNTQVAMPETRLAIIPGAGGTFRLPQLIGHPRALDMVLSGRRISATESMVWGLCTHIAGLAARDDSPQGQCEAVLKEAVKLAGQMCLGAPQGTAAALQAMALETPSEEAENKAYERVLATKDRDEALTAFREKRVPRFSGS